MPLGRFRLTRATTESSADSALAPGNSASTFEYVNFQGPPDTTLKPSPLGSLAHDLEPSNHTHQWPSWVDFEAWRTQEQREQVIELRRVKTYPGNTVYTKGVRYVCSRKGTGGLNAYAKLRPEFGRKMESKRTDCKCVLIVKEYPGVSTVIGNYTSGHNHPVGNANLWFTRISNETREYIAGLLRSKVAPEHIVRYYGLFTLISMLTFTQLQLLHGGVYHNDNTFDDDLDFDLDTVASRNDFVQLRDIRRIEKDIEAETVRLHPDDGQSTLKWVERLRAKGHVLGFKAKSDLPPPQSGLAPDVFVLMIQTGWQRKMFQKYGNFLLCVDATHNTTMYENLL
ncbi:hypothetical protein B0H16DRAFT_1339471 [Mycena metata]|uniref:FAR1 domain-containing protein n=1 Tax=Mycena metata TaxID=1033252 RepID=A0AAD7H9M7_9AGAR|nr:hypothetical protein B0H16DRAFT_1339471 [Mycena metata]